MISTTAAFIEAGASGRALDKFHTVWKYRDTMTLHFKCTRDNTKELIFLYILDYNNCHKQMFKIEKMTVQFHADAR